MSAKDAQMQKDCSSFHTGRNNAGKDLRGAAGHSERSTKGTPSPTLKVPKLPPSPTLSGRLKSPNSEPGKERKPLSIVPRQVSSENSKDFKSAGANGSSRRSDAKFKEAVSKSVTDLKLQGLEESHAVKLGDTKSDPVGKPKELSPKLFNEFTVAGLEEDCDARRKHKETSPQFSSGNEKKASGKGPSPSLCSDCRAAAEGAVCFIGNDGRVSACSTRSAVRLCKNLSCAANNPEYFAALAAPKKYLVSKRHMLKSQPSSKLRGGPPKSPRPDQNSESSCSKGGLPSAIGFHADPSQHCKEETKHTAASDSKTDQKKTFISHEGSSAERLSFDQDKHSEELSCHEEMENDDLFIDNDSDYRDNGGNYSGSMHGGSFVSDSSSIGSANGYANEIDNPNGRNLQKMRRGSLGAIERHDSETVRLRKQLIQERKQAGEWMLDYAIEETVQKLAPTGEPKVKILVQAFERIMSNSEEEAVNCSDEARAPESQASLFRSITFNS